MARHTEVTNGNASPTVKVGSTGTVASLMSRELNTITKVPSSASNSNSSSSSRRKQQTGPVSVPCGANPRKIVVQRKNNSSESNVGDVDKPRRAVRRNGYEAPILGPDCVLTEKNPDPNSNKIGKKGHAHHHVVEVVDLKCNSPMSSRLKKLGFSKLSESIA